MTTKNRTTRRSPRYTVRDTGSEVVLTSASETVLRALGEYEAEQIERHYWVPSLSSGHAGYVREVTDSRPGTLGFQVCERLQHGGSTLTATDATLASVIRSELRAALRRELREQGR